MFKLRTKIEVTCNIYEISITIAKASGVDEYAIKRLVGHSISDITEKVYTDRDLSWLRREIGKIV